MLIHTAVDGVMPLSATQRRVMDFNAGLKVMINQLKTEGRNIALVHSAVTQVSDFVGMSRNNKTK